MTAGEKRRMEKAEEKLVSWKLSTYVLDYLTNKNLGSCLGSNFYVLVTLVCTWYIRRCIGNLYFVYKLFANLDQFYTRFFTPT